ncbi:hypothetical protein EDC01DRAFT_616218 [Geopyxis carbonaria]|nr:hypothetical protein EDC01DRAFT_616218 [Geopyxis carbonaria]
MEATWSSLYSYISSHKGQLVLTAIVSGVSVGSSIIAFQKAVHTSKIKRIKDSIPLHENSIPLTEYGAPVSISNLKCEPNVRFSDSEKYDQGSAIDSRKPISDILSSDLILEQLSRNRVFLGDSGLAKVRNSLVIIVGCGGVGSWTATMLVRSGVGKVRLIDFDQVTLSSLNRHAVANLSDVGTPKVQALRKHLKEVAPWVQIDCRNELWSMENGESLLEGNPTYVVDAIDNIETKVDLLHLCKSKGLKVISSMGAGCKSDPTRVMIGDISESTEDPLSRSTRRRLRIKGVATGIPVVYSTEKPGPGKATLMPLAEEEFNKGSVHELGILPDFRVRILPVLGTMPSFFGLCIANYVLLDIAEYPMEYSAGKNRTKLYEDVQAKLVGQESRLRGNLVGLSIPLTHADIGYIIEEVYKGKSVISGLSTRLALTRWKPLPHLETGNWGESDHRLRIQDIVVMTKEEVKVHEKDVLEGGKPIEDVWGADVVNRVNQRLAEEAVYAKLR